MKMKYIKALIAISLITTTQLVTVKAFAAGPAVSAANSNVQAFDRSNISKAKAPKNISRRMVVPNYTGLWIVVGEDNEIRRRPPMPRFAKIHIKADTRRINRYMVGFQELAYENKALSRMVLKNWRSPATLINHPKWGKVLDVSKTQVYIDMPKSKNDYWIFKERILLKLKGKKLKTLAKRTSVVHMKNGKAINKPESLHDYGWRGELIRR